ncbi:MAG: SpvB/TcaC N-terminal domain-containing protein [bacterium]
MSSRLVQLFAALSLFGFSLPALSALTAPTTCTMGAGQNNTSCSVAVSYQMPQPGGISSGKQSACIHAKPPTYPASYSGTQSLPVVVCNVAAGGATISQNITLTAQYNRDQWSFELRESSDPNSTLIEGPIHTIIQTDVALSHELSVPQPICDTGYDSLSCAVDYENTVSNKNLGSCVFKLAYVDQSIQSPGTPPPDGGPVSLWELVSCGSGSTIISEGNKGVNVTPGEDWQISIFENPNDLTPVSTIGSIISVPANINNNAVIISATSPDPYGSIVVTGDVIDGKTYCSVDPSKQCNVGVAWQGRAMITDPCIFYQIKNEDWRFWSCGRDVPSLSFPYASVEGTTIQLRSNQVFEKGVPLGSSKVVYLDKAKEAQERSQLLANIPDAPQLTAEQITAQAQADGMVWYINGWVPINNGGVANKSTTYVTPQAGNWYNADRPGIGWNFAWVSVNALDPSENDLWVEYFTYRPIKDSDGNILEYKPVWYWGQGGLSGATSEFTGVWSGSLCPGTIYTTGDDSQSGTSNVNVDKCENSVGSATINFISTNSAEVSWNFEVTQSQYLIDGEPEKENFGLTENIYLASTGGAPPMNPGHPNLNDFSGIWSETNSSANGITAYFAGAANLMIIRNHSSQNSAWYTAGSLNPNGNKSRTLAVKQINGYAPDAEPDGGRNWSPSAHATTIGQIQYQMFTPSQDMLVSSLVLNNYEKNTLSYELLTSKPDIWIKNMTGNVVCDFNQDSNGSQPFYCLPGGAGDRPRIYWTTNGGMPQASVWVYRVTTTSSDISQVNQWTGYKYTQNTEWTDAGGSRLLNGIDFKGFEPGARYMIALHQNHERTSQILAYSDVLTTTAKSSCDTTCNTPTISQPNAVIAFVAGETDPQFLAQSVQCTSEQTLFSAQNSTGNILAQNSTAANTAISTDFAGWQPENSQAGHSDSWEILTGNACAVHRAQADFDIEQPKQVVNVQPSRNPNVGTFNISWQLENQGSAVTSYTIERAIDDTQAWSLVATGFVGAEYHEVELPEGTYQYRITPCHNDYCQPEQANANNISPLVTVEIPAWANSTEANVADADLITLSVDDNQAIGALEGKAGVSGGAATYSVPIAIPPGRNGMQPSVSLNYSSRSGNGIAGVGWSLSAGSSIHRCAQIADIDGKNFGVTYSATEDRLCLDGQRLIVTSGTYGAAGATYRTEMDQFLRVTQSHAINDTNSSFVVEYKNGKIATYGSDTNSRHSAKNRSEILEWAIAMEQDRAGNNIKYYYTNVADNNTEYLLESIKYTGTGTADGNRKVEFNYTARTDSSSSYLAGGKTEQTKKLSNIITSSPDKTGQVHAVRRYTLNYAADSVTSSRSILGSIKECAYKTDWQCLPETIFESVRDKNIGSVQSIFIPKTSGTAEVDCTIQENDDLAYLKDVNGDGVAEQLLFKPKGFGNELCVNRLNESGDSDVYENITHIAETGETGYPYAAAILSGAEGDINSDGIKDFTVIRNSSSGYGGEILFYQFDADFGLVEHHLSGDDALGLSIPGATPEEDRTIVFNFGSDPELVDLNGDGYQDIVFKNLRANLNNAPDAVNSPDVNGTNYVIYYQNERSAGTTPHFQEPRTLYTLKNGTSSTSETASLMDLDNNGIMDIVLSSKDSGKVSVAWLGRNSADEIELETESTSTELNITNFESWATFQYVWADLNGDGLKDFIHASGTNSNNFDWKVQMNTGSRVALFQQEQSLGTSLGIHTQQIGVNLNRTQALHGGIKVVDLDNDGMDELLVATGTDENVCFTFDDQAIDQGGGLSRASANICNEQLYELEHEITGPGGGTISIPFDISAYDNRRYSWALLDFMLKHDGAQGTYDINYNKTVYDVIKSGLHATSLLRGNEQHGRITTRPLAIKDYDNDGYEDYGYNIIQHRSQNSSDFVTDMGIGCADSGAYWFNLGGLSLCGTYSVDLSCDVQQQSCVMPADGYYYFKSTLSDVAKQTDTLIKVTTGLGKISQWKYAAISRPTLVNESKLYSVPSDRSAWYLENNDPQKEHFYFTSSMPVVTNFEESNGIGGLNETSYRYKEAIYNRMGRGFQGFRTIVADTPDGKRSVSDFHQVFPLAGKVQQSRSCLVADNNELCEDVLVEDENQTQVLTNTAISKTDYEYEIFNPVDNDTADTTTYWVVPTRVTTTAYEPIPKYAGAVSYRDVQLAKTQSEITTNDVNFNKLYGNIGSQTETIEDDFGIKTSQTVARYLYEEVDTDAWWINKLSSTTSTSFSTVAPMNNPVYIGLLDPIKQVKTSYSEWNAAVRKPGIVIKEPLQGGGLKTEINTQYNNYGLPTSIETRDPSSSQTRTISLTYTSNGDVASADGYFVFEKTNVHNEKVTQKTFPENSQIKSIIDLDGQETSNIYDPFGRLEQTNPPEGTGQPIKYRYASCDSSCANAAGNANIKYKLTTYQAGAATVVEYKDMFNRVLVTETQGFDGRGIFTQVIYDKLGRKVLESQPQFLTPDVMGTRYTYDLNNDGYDDDPLGRLVQKETDQTETQSLLASYSYDKYTTNITAKSMNDGEAVKTINMSRTYSSDKQLMSTTDANAEITRYAYDVEGNTIVIEDAKQQKVKAKFNALGQKLFVDDPNMGVKNFTYTAFDEVETEQDANGNIITYSYDSIGRLTQTELTPANQQPSYVDALYSYRPDTESTPCKGQPETTRTFAPSQGNPNTTDLVHEVSVTYDAYCRPESQTTSIFEPLNPAQNQSFTTQTQYDGNYGRVKAITYPTGLTLETKYNPRGYVTRTQNATSGYVYNEIVSMDAHGQLLASNKADSLVTQNTEYNEITGQMMSINALGMGLNVHDISYTYDGFGNLASQQVIKNAQTTTESYIYDDLQRLSHTVLNNSQSVDYDYDAVGNIILKSDYASNYKYGGDAVCTAGQQAGPNAVCQITTNGQSINDFAYDSNGNQLYGTGKHISYNAYNKPISIIQGNTESTFSYSADKSRYKQQVNGITTLYVGKSFEYITTASATQQKLYMGDVILTATAENTGDLSYEVGFVLRDRLGSVVTIVDENGDITDNKSYDAFGKPRQANMDEAILPTLGWLAGAGDTNSNYVLQTKRGFTDHEHIDHAQLIHMNGRIYDYNLGRFLSVDPYIQDPANSQSMNPYSYIMNNPLAGVDPSGYSAITDFSLFNGMSNFGTGTDQYGQSFSMFFNGGNDHIGIILSDPNLSPEQRMSKYDQFYRELRFRPSYIVTSVLISGGTSSQLNYWTRFGGGLKMVGGAMEVELGGGLCGTGIGCTVAVGLVLHGTDMARSGLYQAYTGLDTDTYTSYYILQKGVGLSRTTANTVESTVAGAASIYGMARSPGIISGVSRGPVVAEGGGASSTEITNGIWKSSRINAAKIEHIFSKKHIVTGTMDLGNSKSAILQAARNALQLADKGGRLQNGSNTIIIKINGHDATVRGFFLNGEIQSLNVFKGISDRVGQYVIDLR